jgi:hypothetical protein
MWKANGRTDAYPWQKLTWPMARWAKSSPLNIVYRKINWQNPASISAYTQSEYRISNYVNHIRIIAPWVFSSVYFLKIINNYSKIKQILAILFRPFGFIAPKTLNYLAFQYFDLSVPDEGYSRNASCTLNLISTFLLQQCTYCMSNHSFNVLQIF